MDPVLAMFPDGVDSRMLIDLGFVDQCCGDGTLSDPTSGNIQNLLRFIENDETGMPSIHHRLDPDTSAIQKSSLLLALVENNEDVLGRLGMLLSCKYEKLMRLILSSRKF